MIIYKGRRLSMKPLCEKSVYTTDLYITGLRSLVEKSVPVLLNKMAENWGLVLMGATTDRKFETKIEKVQLYRGQWHIRVSNSQSDMTSSY